MQTALYRLNFGQKQRGFTLVEMLVVAAMIALFAGMAVFSIQNQYERNKQKAATAEARNIATAMHFAEEDMGVYPKLCFLRFNSANLIQALQAMAAPDRAIDIYSHTLGGSMSRVNKNWKRFYMSVNVEKVAQMSCPGVFPDNKYYDWPADPWNRPYAVYLVSTYLDSTSGNPVPKQRFVTKAGEQPNYFAGVVSYGRNGVPGMVEIPTNDALIDVRRGKRLYGNIDNVRYRLFRNPEDLNNDMLDMILLDRQNPAADNAGPRIREGSDDRFYEL